MSCYVLDTDILTLLQENEPRVVARVAAHPPQDLAITVISVEEQVNGWHARLRRCRRPPDVADAYDRLAKAVRFLGRLTILPFTEAAIARFEGLRAQRLNVGSQDLRIASIVLEHNATLVTRNVRDFQRIATLTLDNWAA